MNRQEDGIVSPVSILEGSEVTRSIDLPRSITPDRPSGRTKSLVSSSLESQDTQAAEIPFTKKSSSDLQRQDFPEAKPEPSPPISVPASARIWMAW